MVKAGGQQTKIFGNEVYRQYHSYDRKGEARFVGDRLRMVGYKARVLYATPPGQYWVVFRRKVANVSNMEYIKKLANYCMSFVKFQKGTKSYRVVTMMGYKEYSAKSLQQVERIIIKDYRKLYPAFPSYLVLQRKGRN